MINEKRCNIDTMIISTSWTGVDFANCTIVSKTNEPPSQKINLLHFYKEAVRIQ